MWQIPCQNFRIAENSVRKVTIYIVEDNLTKVEFVVTFRLVFSSGHIVDLVDIFYVLNFSKSLISISTYDGLGYNFSFDNKVFSLITLQI